MPATTAYDGLPRTDEVVDLRNWHLEYYVSLVESANVHGPDGARWRDVIRDEAENIQRALAWAVEADPAAGMRIVGALGWNGVLVGFDPTTLDALGAHADKVPVDVEARFLAACAALERNHGNLTRGESLASRAVELADTIASTAVAAQALSVRASIRFFASGFEREGGVANDARRAVELARVAGDRSVEADALGWLGDAEAATIRGDDGDDFGLAWSCYGMALERNFAGDVEGARTLARQALELARAAHDPYSEAWMLVRATAVIELGNGNIEEARRSLQAALAVARRNGLPALASAAWFFLASVARAENDGVEAERCGRAAVREAVAGGPSATADLGNGFLVLVVCAAATGQPERAARLYGAGLALDEQTGRPVVQSPMMSRQLARARERLGDDAYDAAREAGAALSRERAVREALAG